MWSRTRLRSLSPSLPPFLSLSPTCIGSRSPANSHQVTRLFRQRPWPICNWSASGSKCVARKIAALHIVCVHYALRLRVFAIRALGHVVIWIRCSPIRSAASFEALKFRKTGTICLRHSQLLLLLLLGCGRAHISIASSTLSWLCYWNGMRNWLFADMSELFIENAPIV